VATILIKLLSKTKYMPEISGLAVEEEGIFNI